MRHLIVIFSILAVMLASSGCALLSERAAEPPPLQVATSNLPGADVAVPYGATVVSLGGVAPYAWSLSPGQLPPGLTFSAAKGVFSGTPTQVGDFDLTVLVRDSSSPRPRTASKNLRLRVRKPVLQITTAGLPDGQIGTAYSARLAATGGVSPYTWSLSSGALPAGLTVGAANGVVSGTPTQAGQFNFTVQVSDSSSPTRRTAPRALQISVTTTTPPLQISTSSLPGGQVGRAYSNTLAATGGTQPYTWSTASGQLPPGLTLAPATGSIAGTPVQTGQFDVAVQVQDSSSPTPRTASQPLRITVGVTPWNEPYLNYAYLRRAWEIAGREWMGWSAGMTWNRTPERWELDPRWPYQGREEGPQAYYIEYTAQGAVNMGLAAGDVRLINELAEFYTVYLNRFTTLGEMRRRAQVEGLDASLLWRQGDDSVRTLLWIERIPGSRSRIRESALYNSQFFHPVSRLIRAITLLPESERSASMRDFVQSYTPLIVQEHLYRFLYEAEAVSGYYGAPDLPDSSLVDIWQTIADCTVAPPFASQHAMFDWDLWLIATAAEILGANANNPALVPLTAEERTRLLRAVQVGVSLFQKKRTLYPETRNYRGEAVGSASYFNGDFDDHDEMLYSGYTGEAFPTERDRRTQPGTSWDLGHFYRVPIFLRSLYDNERATGADFPTVRDVELVANQLMYRVFQGDFNRPLFNNYFDGGNGWYKVGVNSLMGHPPAQHCDARSATRYCLFGPIGGWGLLASFSPDLLKLQHSLATLAWRDDLETEAFKNQYYFYASRPYSFRDAYGELQYPMLLFWLLSGVPEKLQGGPLP